MHFMAEKLELELRASEEFRAKLELRVKELGIEQDASKRMVLQLCGSRKQKNTLDPLKHYHPGQ